MSDDSPTCGQNSAVRLERIHDLVEEFRATNAAGLRISIDDFVAKHPRYRAELEQVLPLTDLLADVVATHSLDAQSASLPITNISPTTGTLGDFRLLRELGRGGMGIVYEAEQISLGRRVALKLFPFAALLDSRQLERFKTEARAAAMLRHRGIVNVLSVGCERGTHYYAMELIDGVSLATVASQARGAVSSDQANTDTQPTNALTTSYAHDRQAYFKQIARLGIRVAEALQYAHSEGILHRDVKPSNLLLDQNDDVFLTDFGLARIGEGGELTATGDIVGTLRYMSPEQLEPNRLVDYRADIYGIGATLYELLATQPMFTESDRSKLLKQVLDEQPKPLRQIDPAIPRDLETIVHKCIARLPIDRFASAADLAEDLERFCDNRPISTTPTSTLRWAQRWMRRNRRLTAISLFAMILLLALATVGPLLALRQFEMAQQLQAKMSLLRSEREQAEQQLYDSQFRNAFADSVRSDFRRASAFLKAYENTDLRSFEYSLLHSRFERDQQRTLGRHWCDIQRTAVSPDNKLLAYGTWDGTVVVLDPASRNEIHQFKLGKHKGCWLEALDFSPDGRFLFAAGENVLQLRRVSDWKLIPFPKPESGKPAIRVASSAAFAMIDREHKTQTLLAVGDRSGFNVDSSAAHLLLFQINGTDADATIERLAALDGVVGSVNDIAFQPNTNVLMACGRDLLIRRWQLPECEPLEPLDLGTAEEKLDRFESVAQIELPPSDSDQVIFSTTERHPNGSVSRVGIATTKSESKQLLMTHATGSEALAVSPNGKQLAVGFNDGLVHLIDLEAPSLLQSTAAHASTVHDIDFDSSGRRFYTASADMKLKAWSTKELEKRADGTVDLIPELLFTTALAWMPNGRQIASAQGSDPPVLKLWDRATGELIKSCPVPGGLYPTDLCVLSESEIAIAAYTWPHSNRTAKIYIWQLDTNEVRSIFESQGESTRLAVSHDRNHLSAAIGKEIVVFDVPGQGVSDRWSTAMTGAVAAHPSRRLIAYFRATRTWLEARDQGEPPKFEIAVWDLERRQHVANLSCPDPVESMAFSPNGTKLAVGTIQGSILLWNDWETSSAVGGKGTIGGGPQKLVGHGPHVWDIEFSKDGLRLASAALDRSVRLWNASTGNPLWDIRTEAAWNYAVAFSPDGRSLSYAGGRGGPFGAIHFIDTKK